MRLASTYIYFLALLGYNAYDRSGTYCSEWLFLHSTFTRFGGSRRAVNDQDLDSGECRSIMAPRYLTQPRSRCKPPSETILNPQSPTISVSQHYHCHHSQVPPFNFQRCPRCSPCFSPTPAERVPPAAFCRHSHGPVTLSSNRYFPDHILVRHAISRPGVATIKPLLDF